MSGAIVAVVFGLAAQQTLGNLIAGVVLISARPFKVGDRVRLQSGHLAGELEGVVASLGLLYTTFARGDDSIMVPNNIVLAAAVVPLREPSAVDLRARLRPDVMPSEVQELLDEGSARRSAPSRTSASRRSTRTRSSSGSRRPPPRTPTARASRTRSSPRSRPSPARARPRSASRRAATTTSGERRRRPAPAAGPAGPRHAGVRVLARSAVRASLGGGGWERVPAPAASGAAR